jgi:hypothetical protein
MLKNINYIESLFIIYLKIKAKEKAQLANYTLFVYEPTLIIFKLS